METLCGIERQVVIGVMRLVVLDVMARGRGGPGVAAALGMFGAGMGSWRMVGGDATGSGTGLGIGLRTSVTIGAGRGGSATAAMCLMIEGQKQMSCDTVASAAAAVTRMAMGTVVGGDVPPGTSAASLHTPPRLAIDLVLAAPTPTAALRTWMSHGGGATVTVIAGMKRSSGTP